MQNTQSSSNPQTPSERAKMLLGMMGDPNPNFDLALPQQWVNDYYRIIREDAPRNFVCYYPKGSIFGEPFPLNYRAFQNLMTLNAQLGVERLFGKPCKLLHD